MVHALGFYTFFLFFFPTFLSSIDETISRNYKTVITFTLITKYYQVNIKHYFHNEITFQNFTPLNYRKKRKDLMLMENYEHWEGKSKFLSEKQAWRFKSENFGLKGNNFAFVRQKQTWSLFNYRVHLKNICMFALNIYQKNPLDLMKMAFIHSK